MSTQIVTAAGVLKPLTAPVIVTDDFMPVEVAMAMRAGIDAHFSDPSRHRAETHQVWNY